MSNEQLKFWITCPDCKTPFGVEPRYILQYLNRVIDAKSGERAEPSVRAASPPLAGEPAPSKPKASKPPYRQWKR